MIRRRGVKNSEDLGEECDSENIIVVSESETESFEDIFTEESEEFESYTSEDEVVQEGSEVDKNEKVFEKTESVPVSHETELQVNKDLKEKNSIGDLQNDIQSLTIKEAVTKKEFSAEVLKENSLEKPFSSREYHEYPESNFDREDPNFVPRLGKFYMHDTRTLGTNFRGQKSHRKLWNDNQSQRRWVHDKFDELAIESQSIEQVPCESRRYNSTRKDDYHPHHNGTFRKNRRNHYRNNLSSSPRVADEFSTVQAVSSYENVPLTSEGVRLVGYRDGYFPRSRGRNRRPRGRESSFPVKGIPELRLPRGDFPRCIGEDPPYMHRPIQSYHDFDDRYKPKRKSRRGPKNRIADCKSASFDKNHSVNKERFYTVSGDNKTSTVGRGLEDASGNNNSDVKSINEDDRDDGKTPAIVSSTDLCERVDQGFVPHENNSIGDETQVEVVNDDNKTVRNLSDLNVNRPSVNANVEVSEKTDFDPSSIQSSLYTFNSRNSASFLPSPSRAYRSFKYPKSQRNKAWSKYNATVNGFYDQQNLYQLGHPYDSQYSDYYMGLYLDYSGSPYMAASYSAYEDPYGLYVVDPLYAQYPAIPYQPYPYIPANRGRSPRYNNSRSIRKNAPGELRHYDGKEVSSAQSSG